MSTDLLRTEFARVRAWVFDLDNTLYPPEARLFDQIERLMTDYVAVALAVSREKADDLRRHYWAKYGTTLAGLMAEHALDPDPYLHAVHQIDFSGLAPAPDLAAAIAALPGRRVVYTNGSALYARGVLKAREMEGVFDAVYGVEHADYHPKPRRDAFEAVFARDGLDPTVGVMFEDDPRNLAVPHEMGMRTVLVGDAPVRADHIHHHTRDLTGFLVALDAG